MFFTLYTDQLMSNIQNKSESSWEEYESEIFNDWVNESLGIDFNDACEAKDSGLFTAHEFHEVVRAYRRCGGTGSSLRYALESVKEEEQEFEDEETRRANRLGYRQIDFI